MIYLTSDLHLCHDRDFIYAARGFSTVEEMDLAIVKNWNETVSSSDEVYVLGDLMLNDIDRGIKLWNSLVGRKYVILGNHDTERKISLYRECPDTVILGDACRFKYGKYSFYLSHYPTMTDRMYPGDHLSSKIINLCGHTHTTDRFSDMDKGIIYHVELDCHDNRPININDIIEDIKGIESKEVSYERDSKDRR